MTQKFNVSQPFGWSHHQSGWSDCTRALQCIMQGNGPLVMTNGVEKLVLESTCNILYQDWCGFVHMTSNCVRSRYIQNKLYNNSFWKESLKKCKCLITLSEDLKHELKQHVQKTISSVMHPTKLDVPQFEYIGDRVMFIGHWLRDTKFFERIRLPDRYQKLLLGSREKSSSIESRFVSNDEYNSLLSRNVVLLKLFASSANNVVVECIARSTPLVINRLPSLEEYLGKDYPLFYESDQEAAEILNDNDLLMRGHDYLNGIDKERFSFSEFAQMTHKKLQVADRKLYI